MRIGVSLPVRELRDDLGAIRAFAHRAEALGVTHLRIPDQVARREYGSLGEDFDTRGRRCTEQMQLLRRLWTEPEVTFEGEFDRVSKNGINPLPVQRPIPMWIGGAPIPSLPVLERIGHHADGWFALCAPEEFVGLKAQIDGFAREVGRDLREIGAESGVGIHGRTEKEWLGIVEARRDAGVTHLCMRTLGGELDAKGHLEALERIYGVLIENEFMRQHPERTEEAKP